MTKEASSYTCDITAVLLLESGRLPVAHCLPATQPTTKTERSAMFSYLNGIIFMSALSEIRR